MNRAVIPELQTLRGLAALLVAISHISLVYPLPKAWRIGVDTVLNAHGAVVLFFVLSGYVLTASLARTSLTRADITAFYLRRLFRIFPAVWAASAVALWVIVALSGVPVSPQPTAWFSGYMRADDLSLSNILLSALSLKNTLVVPIGTVLTELVGSFALPVFVIISIGKPRTIVILLLALALGVFLLARAPHRLDMLSYLFDFGLGMAVFFAGRKANSTPARGSLQAALLSTAVLLLVRQVYYVLSTGSAQAIDFDYAAPIPSFVEGLASAFLVAAISRSGSRVGVLNGRALAKLGDISFSVYLLHFSIMAGAARAISQLGRVFVVDPMVADVLLLMLTLVLTVPVAHLSYVFVETPAISAGRSLADRLCGPKPRTALAG